MSEAGSPPAAPAGTPLTAVPGLGPVTCGWLREAGIETLEQLEACGSIAAWRRIKFLRPRQVSLNALYALEAARLGIPWNSLDPELREALKSQARLNPSTAPSFRA